ncbi:MAG: hypothetical protein GDA56_11435 [Hormoscilla sp. GM7CHS1pb]|nr:hypothetical protein [Hormoscilla sp. GM7CHS1pb]
MTESFALQWFQQKSQLHNFCKTCYIGQPATANGSTHQMTDPRGVSGETTKGWRSMAASRDRSNSGLFLIGGISVNDKV